MEKKTLKVATTNTAKPAGTKSKAALKVVPKTAATSNKPTAAKGGKVAAKGNGKTYKNHRAGSRKELVHKYYDDKGRDPALKFGVTKGLKESTLKQWLNTWGRGAA